MLEREFAELVAEREAAMKRKYKCLTCKYYKREETGLGLIEECNYEKEKQDHQVALKLIEQDRVLINADLNRVQEKKIHHEMELQKIVK